MTELLTAAQMRAIEQAAIKSGAVTGLELMERAGQGVVDAIFAEWPGLSNARGPAPAPPEYLEKSEQKLRAVVLCGPGNNGGDGFVVARLLHGLDWAVEVFLYGDAGKLPPDARVNYERWLELGEVGDLAKALTSGLSSEGNNLVIDAVFGTGLTREMEIPLSALDGWSDLYESLPNGGPHNVAIDLPSGLCSDSGRRIGESGNVFFADLTVSFHRLKLGHVLDDSVETCGRVVCREIGLPENWRATRAVKWRDVVQLMRTPSDLDAFHLSKKSRAGRPNKFSYGHALILSGGPGQTGAARLAARGALRIGAGLVTLGVPPSAQQEAASQLTAIMLKEIETADDLSLALKDSRINALCLGPALGLGRTKPLVVAALEAGLKARPTVLDADALTAFADAPGALFALLHKDCVLTPHAGEFARLFPDIAEKLAAVPDKGPAYSKVDATRDAAKRAGCVVLFKGADTVIATPDGRCSVNAALYERSAPWLATAGAGDVLAGFITGLMARGFDPMQAAETAAWLHVECALKFGPGLIAEDLPEQLPAVFRDLEL
ncbi:bifunctional ADP-dependent NAD(P)H-hydrate dehydratase/NAD(P)H-hydrate epimerase [Cognatishimia sp. WU-CL00825]|uniref:NAD(P)H-hydrate dehydratase n=1 Tax=Cognatishimia sp. WU-CL00825 TaxID=3127658 RepID=UPI003108BB3E